MNPPRLLGLLDGPTLRRASPAFGLAALAGALEALVVPLAALGARARLGSPGWWLVVVGFAALVYVGFRLRRDSPARAAAVLEERVLAVCRALYEQLRRTDLRSVERRPDIAQAFSQHMEALTGVPAAIVKGSVALTTLAALTAYVGLVSPVGVVVWLGLLGLAGLRFARGARAQLAATEELDDALGDVERLLGRAVHGAGQLQLDRRLAHAVEAELADRIERVGVESRRRDGAERAAILDLMIGSRLGLAIVAFSLAAAGFHDVETVVLLLVFVIYAEGPLFDLVDAVHLLVIAESAWRHLETWRADLPPEPSWDQGPGALDTFERIALEGVEFGYAAGWRLGPIDLEVRRGERILLVGHNGSGKTTLMKLICGLYPAQGGRILLDGRPLLAARLAAHRSLFTVVFAEHALFDRLFGLGDPPEAEVRALLARFALDGVVDYVGGRFTRLELSTGQRKRLAMVVALLEDRPIFLLDEWAAHQDPELRRLYHEVLLPELSARGKTVLAISHDDRYFGSGDRVLELVGGRLVEA